MADKSQELKENMTAMLENMELLKKQVELNAVLLRVAYVSLREANFTADQAFELIKTRGVLLS